MIILDTSEKQWIREYMKPITITLLGTNGWYPTNTGNTLSILIQTPDITIILDAGDGIHKIADICPEVKTPACLFLSHFHLDHISGLHSLARLRFARGLSIYGPPGTSDLLHSFIGYPFTVPATDLPYKITITDLQEGGSICGIPVITAPLIHTQFVYGYRFDLGKTITFCTDTGPCDNYLTLADKADLLISECSYLPGQETPAWPHMNPEMAIAAARSANVKKLALIHFAADLYTTIEMRRDIKTKVEGGSDLIIGEDNMVIRL
jgi:ribonuclease BN (tRNA processing enzyme)